MKKLTANKLYAIACDVDEEVFGKRPKVPWPESTKQETYRVAARRLNEFFGAKRLKEGK